MHLHAVNTQFALSLVDAAGSTLSLGLATLSGVPANAGAATGAYWAQELRFPISVTAATTAGFDVNAVPSIETTPKSTSGALWLLDVWKYAPFLAPRLPVSRLCRTPNCPRVARASCAIHCACGTRHRVTASASRVLRCGL
jgi:hypothetical protein